MNYKYNIINYNNTRIVDEHKIVTSNKIKLFFKLFLLWKNN